MAGDDSKIDLKRAHDRQPMPVVNSNPFIHDLLEKDLTTGSPAIPYATGTQQAYIRVLDAISAVCAVSMGDDRGILDPIKLNRERKQYGIRRYGTALQPFNGRDALADCMDELLDAAVYLRQRRYEEESGSTK